MLVSLVDFVDLVEDLPCNIPVQLLLGLLVGIIDGLITAISISFLVLVLKLEIVVHLCRKLVELLDDFDVAILVNALDLGLAVHVFEQFVPFFRVVLSVRVEMNNFRNPESGWLLVRWTSILVTLPVDFHLILLLCPTAWSILEAMHLLIRVLLLGMMIIVVMVSILAIANPAHIFHASTA